MAFICLFLWTFIQRYGRVNEKPSDSLRSETCVEHLQCFLCEEFATGPKLEMCVFACFFVSLLVSWLVNQSVSEFSQFVRFFVGLEDFFHQPKKTIKKAIKNHRESPGRFECRNLYEVAAEMRGTSRGGGGSKIQGFLEPYSKGFLGGKLWHVCLSRGVL